MERASVVVLPPELVRRARDVSARLTEELWAARNSGGNWAGELASSALSTATACTALAVVQRCTGRADLARPVQAGLSWLASCPNADGGWGDTVRSLSNLSTTTLAWASFAAGAGAAPTAHAPVVARAQQWLEGQAGGVDSDHLAPAVIARYGRDRTFSVPILTACALSGVLGSGREAWRYVIPLPFELAAFPHWCYAALRLPVVSYALPALIAIGQARHHHRPSRNPFVRTLRVLIRPRTSELLTRLQPPNGGFLEATPLTSFVVMSLAGSGQPHHSVVGKGVKFLLSVQRSDGSWPIDTNLATWLTTLSINALPAGRIAGESSAADSLRAWLLHQQHTAVHPYTQAAPGGWAWTNLPGGVPDADDTAGALLALRGLGPLEPPIRHAADAGLRWLLDLQNRDGGIPTFCRGWGALPFDQSSPDLTAHAIRAWLAWEQDASPELRRLLPGALGRALGYLKSTQRADGSWLPLWFGNQHAPGEGNPTYGTSRVLCALADVASRPPAVAAVTMAQAAIAWLAQAQHSDGGWGGDAGVEPSMEETALAVQSLAQAAGVGLSIPGEKFARGMAWLVDRTEAGGWRTASPIGFYFSRLWYYEKLYPLIFTVGALGKALDLAEGG